MGRLGWAPSKTAVCSGLCLLLLLIVTPQSMKTQALRVRPKTLGVRPQLVCVLCYLTVTATPATVTFTLTKLGLATGSAPIVITTQEFGLSSQVSLKLFGYFSSPTAALTDGASTPDNIPTSAVLGQMTTGSPTTFTAFTQTNALGPAGAGLLLYSVVTLSTTGCPLLVGCRTDNLNMEINLGALPQLPAGTYTGTLTLQAQAM